MATTELERRHPAVRVPPAPPGSLRPVARLTAMVTARATRGEAPRVFTTLGRHPRLFRSWLRFAAMLMLRSDLTHRDRELVILRTAWRCRSWYEWAQHCALATRWGLDDRDLERVAEGPAAEGWHLAQRLLLEATDELHDHRVISDRTWDALAAEFTERQLIELCILVGHYEMLASTLNSLGVEPEATTLSRMSGRAAEVADRLRDDLVATRGAPEAR